MWPCIILHQHHILRYNSALIWAQRKGIKFFNYLLEKRNIYLRVYCFTQKMSMQPKSNISFPFVYAERFFVPKKPLEKFFFIHYNEVKKTLWKNLQDILASFNPIDFGKLVRNQFERNWSATLSKSTLILFLTALAICWILFWPIFFSLNALTIIWWVSVALMPFFWQKKTITFKSRDDNSINLLILIFDWLLLCCSYE